MISLGILNSLLPQVKHRSQMERLKNRIRRLKILLMEHRRNRMRRLIILVVEMQRWQGLFKKMYIACLPVYPKYIAQYPISSVLKLE